MSSPIPAKAGKVLNIILLALLLILIRVWYLAIVQHDEYLLKSQKPRRRTLIQQAERGTIRDRFNLPLAINKVGYRASVCYAHLRQIPAVTWQREGKGKAVKVYTRLAYISELSKLLGKELSIDPQKVEDIIHGKAALFPHTPFVIKEELTETEYYRLKMLEKEWLGLQAEQVFKRVYPQGKIACDIIGYMGAISQKEHTAIAQEMQELHTFLTQRDAGELAPLPKGFDSPLEVRERLKELQEKAYTINDMIGKSGIEAAFDEALRGYYGKNIYEVDTKGNFLRKLPSSRSAISGQRLTLTLSSELQAFAESLLARQEVLREERDVARQKSATQPWIKGGAIVAMLPKTGEVVALASYPRFDPNDFIPTQDPLLKSQKREALLEWLENEEYLGEIWDGKRLLSKECFYRPSSYVEHTYTLSWENYLKMLLSPRSSVLETMLSIADVSTLWHVQDAAHTLLALSKQDSMRALFQTLYNQGTLPLEEKKAIRGRLKEQEETSSRCKRYLDRYLSSISTLEDKLLVLDLCRMVLDKESVPSSLLSTIGSLSPGTFREHSQNMSALRTKLRFHLKEIFHDSAFASWRKTSFKEYLQKKRQEEKVNHRYVRPYTEYLDLAEKHLFNAFWKAHEWNFVEAYLLGASSLSEEEKLLLHPYLAYVFHLRKESPPLAEVSSLFAMLPRALALDYAQSLRSFSELTHPLYGKYPLLRKGGLEKHLAMGFYPKHGYGYGRSLAFRQSTPAGSVFKLVIAYEALRERFLSLKELNPLTLIDEIQPGGQILGRTLNNEPIYRLYKGGRLPKSSHPQIGKIDILGALERSSNIYFALLASDVIHDPSSLADAARLFGYGAPTGIELKGEIGGHIPTDLAHNRTGLYSFAIGQHSLVVTPLQTALMMATIANQGMQIQPKIVKCAAGKQPSSEKEDTLFSLSEFPLREPLSLLGISFPLFTETARNAEDPYVHYTPLTIKRSLLFPPEIRHLLLKGMQRVIQGGTARVPLIRALHEDSQAIQDYVSLSPYLVGKTGSAEILYKQKIDAETKAEMKKHVWFAGISFKDPPTGDSPESWGEADLVVVVYLRFGEAGKEAAPLAAQMARKWRELQN